jgi:hypothetical protein
MIQRKEHQSAQQDGAAAEKAIELVMQQKRDR